MAMAKPDRPMLLHGRSQSITRGAAAALMVAVLVLLQAAASAGRAESTIGSDARLIVLPDKIGPAERVTIQGTGWGRSGCKPLVQLRAYVIGVSPYRAHEIPAGVVSASGSFELTWTTPKVADRLEWTIRGEQRCSSGAVVRYVTLVIA